MAILCIFVVVVGFVLSSMWSSSNKSLPSGAGGSLPATTQSRDYGWLLRNGSVAQGILLSVSATSSGTNTSGSLKLQKRDLVIDVEVPGSPPYELRSTLEIPSHLAEDILPGTTVELRVDPKDPTQLMVFGPGVGLPLAPFAAAPPVASGGSASSGSSVAPMSAGAATYAGADLGNQSCPSCGALVSVAAVQKHGNHCTTCGALWD